MLTIFTPPPFCSLLLLFILTGAVFPFFSFPPPRFLSTPPPQFSPRPPQLPPPRGGDGTGSGGEGARQGGRPAPAPTAARCLPTTRCQPPRPPRRTMSGAGERGSGASGRETGERGCRGTWHRLAAAAAEPAFPNFPITQKMGSKKEPEAGSEGGEGWALRSPSSRVPWLNSRDTSHCYGAAGGRLRAAIRGWAWRPLRWPLGLSPKVSSQTRRLQGTVDAAAAAARETGRRWGLGRCRGLGPLGAAQRGSLVRPTGDDVGVVDETSAGKGGFADVETFYGVLPRAAAEQPR